MGKTQLVELLNKYRELRVLRARREMVEAAGRGWPPEEGISRRASFRRLSTAFPGALRELDATPVEVLAAKARAVEEEIAAVAAGGSVSRRWVTVVVDFHTTLARALAVKRWLGAPEGPAPAPADVIDALRHPPGGRVVTWVWQELERRHGLARETLIEMVFGSQS